MHLLLFVIYSIVLCYLLLRMRFFRDSGIRPNLLLLLFALRVAAGCLHNIIAYRFYPNHGDIWAFFQGSFITRQELFHDFPAFIADNSTWAYLPYNVVVFLHVIFNFFSFGNLYINTLLFSFGVFAGSIALFRAFRGFLGNGLLSGACALLIPSTLYWTACVYKEGLIYLSLGFFFYQLQAGLAMGWNNKRVVLCLLFFLLAVFFRAGIAVSLLPGLAIWMLIGGSGSKTGKSAKADSPKGSSSFGSNAAPRPFARIVLAITLACIAILGFVKPAAFSGVFSYISGQQEEFQSLQGHSRLYLPRLEPTTASFLRILPAALLNGFFQPLPGVGGQPVYLVFSIELLLVWCIVLFACATLLRRPPGSAVLRQRPSSAPPSGSDPAQRSAAQAPRPGKGQPSTGFAICCLVFSVCGMLLIGYIIPFAGAIVRYRSLYLPFLLAPFFQLLGRQPYFKRLNERIGRLILERP